MSNTKTEYTPELYRGMTTISGIVAALFVLCSRLTVYIRAASQVLLALLLIASLVSCLRMYDSMAAHEKHRKANIRKVSELAVSLASAVLFLFIIVVVNVIPVIPTIVKSLTTGAGVIIWLRLQMKFLGRGVDSSEARK